MRRTLLIVVWTGGGFLAWYALAWAAGAVLWHLFTKRQFAVPDRALELFSYGFFLGGLVVLPAIIALLGMRGKLPGTSKVSRPARRGLEVARPTVRPRDNPPI